jgi:hypothetical protein
MRPTGRAVLALHAAVLALLGMTAFLGVAPALAKSVNVDGERFSSSSATLVAMPTGGEPYCGATQQGSVTFSTSGTASGPYPGTFTETGQWDFDLITEQTFHAQFTIASGGKTIKGVILYDNTATGAEGRSLIANYGSCTGSQSGGAYSTCESEALTGACGGQAVAFIGAEGISQTFQHPTGSFHMAITEGNEQSAGINGEFAAPLGVRVTDSLGAAVGGVTVTYTPAKRNPSGSPQGPWTTTWWDGTASMPFFAGPTPGTYTVTAKGSKGAKAVFTETNLP